MLWAGRVCSAASACHQKAGETRERERERQRQRQRETETEAETEAETERDRERQRETETERQTETENTRKSAGKPRIFVQDLLEPCACRQMGRDEPRTLGTNGRHTATPVPHPEANMW